MCTHIHTHGGRHTHIGREPMQSGAARRAAGSTSDVDLHYCEDDLYEKKKSIVMKETATQHMREGTSASAAGECRRSG